MKAVENAKKAKGEIQIFRAERKFVSDRGSIDVVKRLLRAHEVMA